MADKPLTEAKSSRQLSKKITISLTPSSKKTIQAESFSKWAILTKN